MFRTADVEPIKSSFRAGVENYRVSFTTHFEKRIEIDQPGLAVNLDIGDQLLEVTEIDVCFGIVERPRLRASRPPPSRP